MIPVIMVCPSSTPRDHDPQAMITRKDDGGIMITGIMITGIMVGRRVGQVWADSIVVPFE